MTTRVTPPIVDNNVRVQVARYAKWMAAQSQRTVHGSSFYDSDAARAMNEYIENAGKTVQVGKKQVAAFAPFRPELSALQTFTPGQVIGLIVLAIAWGCGLFLFRQGTLIATIGIISVIYTSHLALHIVLALNTFGGAHQEDIDQRVILALNNADWPSYTILCPLYKEAQVVPQFVQAMRRLSYPTHKLQILLLTEQDDRETRDAIRALNLPPHFQIVTVPDGKPRTKPRACNYGLMQTTGQYVVIYDAEDIPEPLQLKKAVLTFANHGPELACAQAKLNYYNPEQNMLTRWFTAEYSLWFDLILPGLQRTGLSLPLGGTSNHFQVQTLRALGAWDAYNVTEDCDLGLRLARYRFDTVILNSVTYEEANSQLKNWIRQRSRWLKGYMQTYLVYMRHPWRYLRPSNFREFLSLQLVIGSKTGILFLNPLLWLTFLLNIIFHSQLGHIFQSVYPKPLLYLSALTMLFGNFLYLYVYLLACVRRKQYSLVKWALFIPIYWLLMSVAACMALFQLIFKPHYWEKTIHGLHLRKSMPDMATFNAQAQEIADEQTIRVPSLNGNGHHAHNGHSASLDKESGLVTTVTTRLRSLMTLPTPAISRAELKALQSPAPRSWSAVWLFVVVVMAFNLSIAACFYSFQHDDILLYNEAYVHLVIPLRVIYSHFSIAQFGGVWLPLPHILMLPFIWNTFLLRSGLAGSIPSMVCYVISAAFVFLFTQRLTRDNLASFAGTLVFMLNPNVLYLQTTPLSEPLCILTFTMAAYFFLAWTQEDHPRYLVLAAISTLLATLARYDGWILCALLPTLIIIVGCIKRRKRGQIEADLIIFCAPGLLGIVLWVIWCAVIFGDPLYFLHSQFSAQTQQTLLTQSGSQYAQYAAHDIAQSFRYYILTVIDVVGPILFVLGALEMVRFLLQHKSMPERIGMLAFLAPFVFYVIALSTGQINLYIPEAVPSNAAQQLFNPRFGSEMVAPLAVFLGVLIAHLRIPAPGRIWGSFFRVAFVILIIIQSGLIGLNGIVTLQDGQYGVSCAPYHQINIFLAQHYEGGKILEDLYSSDIDGIDAGIDYKNFVTEGSGQEWTTDLHDPARVDWIIVRPPWLTQSGDQRDLVAQSINLNSSTFLSNFTLAVQEPTGLELYHRTGRPPLPTRAVPQGLLNEHLPCGTGG